MCGVAGFFTTDPLEKERAREILAKMAAAMRHRGPDDEGVFWDGAAGIGLAHRRLRILDLSAAGRQPMTSPSGRYVISYNGEIYNFAELARELASETGFAPKGRSDTEVFLAAVDAWGLKRALERSNGMFAFALWDQDERTLHLARDRLGIKPLYYGTHKGTLLFASELVPLSRHPSFDDALDLEALALFLRYGFIPSPRCIYRGLRKLPPGTLVSVRSPASLPEPARYWSAAALAMQRFEQPFTGNDAEAEEELDALITDAVRLQRVSDVPVGVLLSGGIDSSLVVAKMHALGGSVRTFSIGYRGSAYDEAEDAARVAEHLGTEHTAFYVTPEEALGVIPLLPRLYDEPFADPSQVPTFLVSRLAREHVTVALTGDGGDELWAGYDRYVWGRRLWALARRMPLPLRRALGRLASAVPPPAWDRLAQLFEPAIPRRFRTRMMGEKLHKLAYLSTARDEAEFYRALSSLAWQEPAPLLAPEVREPRVGIDPATRSLELVELMMLSDLLCALPDDMLTKVDRASMGVSLEARVPLLDHRIVELAWRLPLKMKIEGGVGKAPLRRVLYRHVPRALVERPKMGFGVPIDEWLRGPLRHWAEALLDEQRLRRAGIFDPAPIRRAFSEHLEGKPRQRALWAVLMFEAWREIMPNRLDA